MPEHVWGVWSEEDVYGEHLRSLHATEASARAEADRLNAERPGRHSSRSWPFVVIAHEVRP